MSHPSPFKWRHFEAEIILLCVRWYLRYSLSYRDLAEMRLERGLSVDHTTIYRWVQRYAPELENAVGLTSKPAPIPGEWMRRTSRSSKPGCICIGPSTHTLSQKLCHDCPTPSIHQGYAVKDTRMVGLAQHSCNSSTSAVCNASRSAKSRLESCLCR